MQSVKGTAILLLRRIIQGIYSQLELIFKAALLRQINITYIHKEKQDSGMRHTIKVYKE